jgi:uncharacterized protein (TIGR03084 family)
VSYEELLDDLVAEEASLDAVVSALDDTGWETPTPAEGWEVRDSIAHLAATEEWALISLTDADRFRRELDEMAANPAREAEVRRGLLGKRQPTGLDTLAWWRDRRHKVLTGLRSCDGRDRVAWFGPDMSAMSFATARLMETWAHGRDVCDALGVEQVPTARLRHVAELGMRTRGWAYVARGKVPPEDPVRVELRGPDGEQWAWGDESAEDVVRGPALDFCLVVTQRRHHDDTALEITGDRAREWIEIAQAFAGAASDNRPRRA